MKIRKAIPADFENIWQIIKQTITTGDSYVFLPDTPKDSMLAYWCADDKHTFVAELGNEIVGTFVIQENQPGYGSHIANISYMTHPGAYGKGIGKAMGVYSITKAKELGYKAIQFNLVLSTNKIAVSLWQKLGFSIIGEIPEAFNHPKHGYVSAFIMYQKL